MSVFLCSTSACAIARVSVNAPIFCVRCSHAFVQVRKFGMNGRIGPLSFPTEENSLRPFSEETAQVIDEEARALVRDAYERALGMIRTDRVKLEAIAQLLLQREVLHAEDLTRILGERQKHT